MCALRVVTWNVNSIRTRLPRLLAILKRHDPDIVCLQETKVVDDSFPFSDIENAGYYAAVHGQKAYNGVAVLTKQKPLNIVCSMKDETEDKQARLLAVTSSNVRVLSIYVPNGGEIGSVKWEYKLEWFERMRKYLEIHENPALFKELTPIRIVDEVPGQAALFYGYLEPDHNPISIRWFFDFPMPRLRIDWGWRDFGTRDGG